MQLTKTHLISKIAEAQKAKASEELSIFREAFSRVQTYEIATKTSEASSEEISKIFSKMRAEREESLAIYEKAGRADLAEKESAGITFLNTLLPKTFSEAESRLAAAAVIVELSAKLKREKGNVMKRAKELHGQQINMKIVAQVCDETLV